VVATVLAAVPAAAQQFSADLVVIGGDAGDAPLAGRVYVADGKVRIETSDAEGPGIVIADVGEKSVVTLLPAQKLFTRMRRPGRKILLLLPVDPGDPCPAWQEMSEGFGRGGAAWRCSETGRPDVDGRRMIEYRAVTPGGEERTGWLDPALRFFVRMEDGRGRRIALEHIEEGPQPAGFFAIPTEYEDLDLQDMLRQFYQGGVGHRTPKNPG
jgi:hypothetical protein